MSRFIIARPLSPRQLPAAQPCEGSGRLRVLTIAYGKGGQQHEEHHPPPPRAPPRPPPAAAQGSNRALSAGRARQHLTAASQIRSHGDCLAAGRRWHRHRGRRRVRQGNAQIRGLYGAWWSYIYDRLSGYEISQAQAARGRQGWTFGSRERAEFAEFYAEDGGMGSAGQTGGSSTSRLFGLVCTGPAKYSGHARARRDIDNLKAAPAAAHVEEGFVPAVSPATLQIIPNEHYKSREDYTWALAEAIREEYKAIVDAGIILQVDDPALVDIYDWWFSRDGDTAGYRKWAEFQIEAVNHALEGIPEDRVRFHICWGSWHGPHKTDVPLKDVVDLLIKVKAQAYSVEAGK